MVYSKLIIGSSLTQVALLLECLTGFLLFLVAPTVSEFFFEKQNVSNIETAS